MDKDNKYYGIIENLVKNHKKFAGCEAILDEIIDDVFAHSEVIINSVSNESVVNSYLEKVVSTSVITVPKKLGFNRYAKHTVIKPVIDEPIVEEKPVENVVQAEQFEQVEPINDIEQTEEIPTPQENEIKVNTELVDKMINLAEKPQETEEIELDKEDEELLKDLQDENSEDSLDTVSVQAEPVLSEIAEEPEIEDFGSDEIEFVAEEDNNVADDINEAQEDDFSSLLNFNSDETEQEQDIDELSIQEELQNAEIQDIQDESEEIEEEKVVEDDFISEIQDSDFADNQDEFKVKEDVEMLDVTDVSEEDDVVSLDVDTPQAENILEEIIPDEHPEEEITNIGAPLNLDETSEEIIEEQINFEGITPLEETAPVDESLSSASDFEQTEILLPENDDLFNVADDGLMPEASDESLEEFNQYNENELLPTDLENITIDSDIIPIGLEETKEADAQPKEVIAKTDYSVFAYIPELKEESDLNEIGTEIADLDAKFPNLMIAQVFNLKYKENRTINEIAEELGIQKNDVLVALTKIVDVV